jgi:hypothetical protein
MEWMATMTGDHVGYPGFQDLGNFSPRRGGGAKIHSSFSIEFPGSADYVVIFSCLYHRFERIFLLFLWFTLMNA